MTAYLVIVTLFLAPLAMNFLAQSFFPTHPSASWIKATLAASPFAAAFSLPLTIEGEDILPRVAKWPLFFGFLGFYAVLNVTLNALMIWFFHRRWRVSE